MNEESKSNPERQPLTVAHGKKLYEQGTQISRQVVQLAPLLALLEPATPTEDDPISQILHYLETLATIAQHQALALTEIDAKLNALIVNSNIEMP